MEAWERVFVDSEFLANVHNVQNCIGCHGGVAGVDDMEAAHEGVVRDPLEDSERACSVCHTETAAVVATSLHQNLTGMQGGLIARGADFTDPHMQEAWDNHCTDCHTTCGQCHISRPTAMGGGLLKEHDVKKITSMGDTCMACHSARTADEYLGRNEGVEGSVHWLEAGMSCYDCHDVSEYHGDGTEHASRYEGAPGVSCLECHPEAEPGQSEILEHNIHDGKVACEVCHVSGPYKTCYNCHAAVDDQGLPYFKIDDSQLAFKIGHNPVKSEDRPWEYVLVRHVPVSKDLFAFYGDNLLPNFDDMPTWKYATPHNIQRVTPQNQSCNSCHGNADLFLTADDVAPDELAANANVIVREDEIPPTSWGPYPEIEPARVTPSWVWLVALGPVVFIFVAVVAMIVARRSKVN